MTDKIKLDLGADFTMSDKKPEPFKCELCGVVREYMSLLHDGDKKICSRHYAVSPLGGEASAQLTWKDMWQINAASAVIREIKNESRN